MKEIAAGTQGISEIDVKFENTAAFVDSVLPPVHSTPQLVGLCENACREAIKPYYDEGEDSVGAGVNIKHLAGSPIGFHVTAKATVKSVNGRMIDFDVEAFDDLEKVAEGTHTRVIINSAKHAARIAEKKARKENK